MEPSQLSSAIKGKCPRCRRGNLFANTMYGFKAQRMHDRCLHCGLKFEREPGYFYVAMFVSYALNVVQMLAIAMATYFITGNLENPYLYMIVIFTGIILLAPINFRYSRIILLYWLTPGLHYIPDMNKERGRLK